jgi:hypothetical protein
MRWPCAERADEDRIHQALFACCPVCRRPASSEPLPVAEALQRLARHLTEAHDGLFASLLKIHLGRDTTEMPRPDRKRVGH